MLEETLNSLLKKVTSNKRSLQDLDQELLKKLNESQGNLLDDEGLLDILKNTKTQAKDISIQLQEADIKTKEINLKREIYRAVATRGSVMYFCMIEIANVNWMYNSSLSQFLKLFQNSIDNSKDLLNPVQGKKRVEDIESYLTYEVFEYVNRGLFSAHKISFLLMICFKVMKENKELTENDVGLFLKVGSSIDKKDKQRPNLKWITEATWANIIGLSNHFFNGQTNAFFKGLPDSFTGDFTEAWEKWFNHNTPETQEIPAGFGESIRLDKNSAYLEFCFIRSLKPDRTVVAANKFIRKILKDKRFVETPPEDISSLVSKSSEREPVLYLLSEGADPTGSIRAYAQRHKKVLTPVSLGEGQGREGGADHQGIHACRQLDSATELPLGY